MTFTDNDIKTTNPNKKKQLFSTKGEFILVKNSK